MKRIIYVLIIAFACCGFVRADEKCEIRIASFNLRMDTPTDGIDAWMFRKDAVNDLINYYDFDVFGVQEALIHMIKNIELLDQYSWYGRGRLDGIHGDEHSAIFYKKDKYKLLDKGDFWYSETPDIPSKGWDAPQHNRICTWIKLQDIKSGNVFFVFNSHFDHIGKIARRESAKLLNAKIKEIAKSSPAFSTGDYNATPDSTPIKEILAGGVLKSSYDLSQQPPYGTVGTTNNFNLLKEQGSRIDHIFVTHDISVLKYGVVNDQFYGRFYSDHFPIMIDAEF